jgi:hypothetical protein
LGRFLQKSQFIPDGIGENRLKNKALALLNQFLPELCDDLGSFIGVDFQFPRDVVRIEKTQASGFKMGMEKRGLARTIRPGQGHQNGPLVQDVAQLSQIL